MTDLNYIIEYKHTYFFLDINKFDISITVQYLTIANQVIIFKIYMVIFHIYLLIHYILKDFFGFTE